MNQVNKSQNDTQQLFSEYQSNDPTCAIYW